MYAPIFPEELCSEISGSHTRLSDRMATPTVPSSIGFWMGRKRSISGIRSGQTCQRRKLVLWGGGGEELLFSRKLHSCVPLVIAHDKLGCFARYTESLALPSSSTTPFRRTQRTR